MHVPLLLSLLLLTSLHVTAQTTLEIDASNSPYYFPNGYLVQPGDSLTFGPGAVVYVGDSMDITVEGYFRSEGTEDQPVIIDAMNPSIGWGALDLKSSADSLSMTYTYIEEGRVYINQCPTYLYNVHFNNHQPLIWSDILLRIWFTHPVIDHCSIDATNRGEGIICHDCINPQITQSRFHQIPDAIEMINCFGGRIANSVFTSMNDDAIDLNNCSDVHIDSNFIYNTADRGMEIGSEAFGSCSNIRVTRNQVVWCKEAVNFKEGSTGTVENNTFYRNDYGVKTVSAAGFGPEEVDVMNCIFAENTVDVWTDTNATVSVSYSCFAEQAPEGIGNFVADPRFVAPLTLDYTLLEGSPCINNGNPNSPLDPDGSPNDIGAVYRPESVLNAFAEQLHIWPVPSSDQIFIRLPDHFETITVFDVLGNRVYTADISDDLLLNFDVSGFAQGVYFVHATKNNETLIGSFSVF